MSYQLFALIPARSKSKGLRDKNIKKIGSLSLIDRSINFARSLGIETIVLSTDSPKYISLSDCKDVFLSGLRPGKLSSDSASTLDVVEYEWIQLEESKRRVYDYCLLLEPTSPFRYNDIVRDLIDIVTDSSNSYLSGFTASEVESSRHPYKYFKIKDETIYRCCSLEPSIPGSNRHELDKEYYVKDGMAYIFSRNEVMNKRKLITPYSYVKTHKMQTVNIDSMEDFIVAEYLEGKLKFS